MKGTTLGHHLALTEENTYQLLYPAEKLFFAVQYLQTTTNTQFRSGLI